MKKNKTIFLFLIVVTIGSFFFYVLKNQINNFYIINVSKKINEYKIKGIDVSHHQGNINWEKINIDSVKFVFLKSTQGNSYVDSKFKINVKNIRKKNIPIGAYHYYIVKNNPVKQFENFTKHTPKNIINLPPIIDIEFGGNEELMNENNKESFIRDFTLFEKLISDFYGKKPIFYTSGKLYNLFLKNNFNNKIWICDFSSKRINYVSIEKIIFWQHSDKGKINGIPTNVDLNVFTGDEKEFQDLITKIY